jgi:hypothetical protein
MVATLSETARHARAELETLATAQRARELARLIERAGRMLDDQAETSGNGGLPLRARDT